MKHLQEYHEQHLTSPHIRSCCLKERKFRLELWKTFHSIHTHKVQGSNRPLNLATFAGLSASLMLSSMSQTMHHLLSQHFYRSPSLPYLKFVSFNPQTEKPLKRICFQLHMLRIHHANLLLCQFRRVSVRDRYFANIHCTAYVAVFCQLLSQPHCAVVNCWRTDWLSDQVHRRATNAWWEQFVKSFRCFISIHLNKWYIYAVRL